MKPHTRWLDYAIWTALGGGLLLLFTRRSSGPEEGALASAIELPLANRSGVFSLAAQRGRPVVMEVFASWCGACRRATPTLAEAWRAHADDATFIGVSVDERPQDAAAVKASWGIPYDVVHDDGSVARNYRVSRLPTVVVIGRDGTVRHVTTGTPSVDELGRWLKE